MLNIVAIVLNVLSLILNIVGLAIPYWMYKSFGGIKVYSGLWQVCSEPAVLEDKCLSITEGNLWNTWAALIRRAQGVVWGVGAYADSEDPDQSAHQGGSPVPYFCDLWRARCSHRPICKTLFKIAVDDIIMLFIYIPFIFVCSLYFHGMFLLVYK